MYLSAIKHPRPTQLALPFSRGGLHTATCPSGALGRPAPHGLCDLQVVLNLCGTQSHLKGEQGQAPWSTGLRAAPCAAHGLSAHPPTRPWLPHTPSRFPPTRGLPSPLVHPSLPGPQALLPPGKLQPSDACRPCPSLPAASPKQLGLARADPPGWIFLPLVVPAGPSPALAVAGDAHGSRTAGQGSGWPPHVAEPPRRQRQGALFQAASWLQALLGSLQWKN